MENVEPDPTWEAELYSKGKHLNLYPFDLVVSFLFRWAPCDKPRSETSILELGCGAGNNLWFAAREGFQVSGIDGSMTAVEFAKNRLSKDGLSGDLRVGNFLRLPWKSESFDIGFDRSSLTCAGYESQKLALAEVRRVLRSKGIFLYNGYSDEDTSATSGELLADGRLTKIREGSLVGVGALAFLSKDQVVALFDDGWEILKLQHLSLTDLYPRDAGKHSEWRVVVRKL